MYQNAAKAFVQSLANIFEKGSTFQGRGGEVRELRSQLLRIEKPLQRIYLLEARNNNPFATIAETIWVIAGRNDLEYLSHYLPRASDFSDDGKIWRAGYGPRLRNWYGVDQFTEVYRTLKQSLESRRAVMIIFDPQQDYQESKDIPCNNWLHFLVREGKLHLNVVIRSNDIMWGFSGINTFEWSVLQEMMAYWLGLEVGDLSYFASSLHLYARHYEQAKKIVTRAKLKTPYDFGFVGVPFGTPFDSLDQILHFWFEIEQELRSDALGIKVSEQIGAFPDPFLKNCLQMLQIYNFQQQKVELEKIVESIARLPSNDFKLAAIEYFSREKKDVFVLSEKELDYFNYFWTTEDTRDVPSFDEVWALLRTLHYKKTLVYKDSWKKRGEVIGVFANISRKFDRIESLIVENAQPTSDETLLDTLADLGIYAAKYLTYLAEHYPDITTEFIEQYMPGDNIERYSGNEAFDAVSVLLVRRYQYDESIRTISELSSCYAIIERSYQLLESILIGGDWRDADPRKCSATADLATGAIHYLLLAARNETVGLDKLKNYVAEL